MQTFDIVIYGSSSGAVAAAIQAASNGRSIAIVSPQDHIGGIQIDGLGATDIDNQEGFSNSSAVSGLALDFHRRISKHYNRLDKWERGLNGHTKDQSLWTFEPKVAEKIIADWLAEYPSVFIIKERLSTDYDAVEKIGTRIMSIKTCSGMRIQGKIFMECTYEGDLLAAAGVSTVIGRESRAVYNESLAGIREKTTYTQFEYPIDPYVIEGKPSSGLIYGISSEAFGKPGQGDGHLAAYSFRLTLTDVKENRLPISRPADYDPGMFELHRRHIKAGGSLYSPKVRLPNRKTDLIGSEGPLATDLLGMNDGWPEGESEERQRIREEAIRFTKGLLYFFTSDESLPVSDKLNSATFRHDCLPPLIMKTEFRDEWKRWGFCRDEYPDNGHFPRNLYIRDARRMVSDYVVTQHTASLDSTELPANDPISIAYWPTDTHCARRIVKDGYAYNEGFIFKDGHQWKPFGISYKAVIPKRQEVSNLLSPVCPSASHVGYGAIRLEHQFYSLGQACSQAAEICLRTDVAVQDVQYSDLSTLLADCGLMVDVAVVGLPTHYPAGKTSIQAPWAEARRIEADRSVAAVA